MTKVTACPDVSRYQQLAHGGLSPAEGELLLVHLDGCAACGERLAQLPDNDTLADVLRQVGTAPDAPVRAALAQLAADLSKLRPGAAGIANEQTVAPADRATPKVLVACPACGKKVHCKPELAGKRLKCPQCHQVVTVTLPSEATTPTMAPAEGAGRDTLTQAPAAAPTPADARNAELIAFLAPAQQPDELGRLGRYRILKILGAGGMGVVFRAEDTLLKRAVALKAMLPNLAGSGAAKQRFLREAQAAAAIKHDHIVAIHDVGEERGAPYLAMEFLEGEALDERLKREPHLPPREAMRIGREVAEGLAAAHGRGLIHRDIKPANVWLEGPRARAKILDFGLARAADDDAHLTQSGAIIGTPAYMAPEQAAGKKVDARCDLFSLGCMLYQLCTGSKPFSGSDTISTLMAVSTEQPRPPRAVKATLPVALSDLVMHLLEKDPADRPASAQQVVDRLAALESLPAAAEPRVDARPNPSARKRTGPRQEPSLARRLAPAGIALAVAALALVLVGTLVVAGVVLFWQSPHGLVRIEINDPNLQVAFDQDSARITGKDTPPIRIRAGEHTLHILRDNVEVEATRLVVKDQETTVVKVEYVAGKLVVAQNGPGLPVAGVGVAGPAKSVPPPPGGGPRGNALPTGPTFKNGLGMTFARIPAGRFLMGSPKSEIDRLVELAPKATIYIDFWDVARYRSEGPQHEVEMTRPFYLGTTEVTVGQFRQYVNESGQSAGERWQKPGFEQTDHHPVVFVSWEDAMAFCKWLSKKEGKTYRLPTEAEWEYCCRSGLEGKRYCFGDDETQLAQYAWYGPKCATPHPVAQLKPNAWGLFDMHGNAGEWCLDIYGQDYYAKSPRRDPLCKGPANEFNDRPFRGGGYVLTQTVRSAFRAPAPAELRRGLIGFRVALVSEPEAGPASASATPPSDDPWLKAVAALSAAQQIKAVTKNLQELNPGFDGNLEHEIEDNVVRSLTFKSPAVYDCSPVRALTGLQEISFAWDTQHIDLAPLKHLKLRSVNCAFSRLKDLAPLKGMPLTFLDCGGTLVSDLAPLQGMPLETLYCSRTPIADLSPLRGMPLTRLQCKGTRVSDLSPLRGLPLQELHCDFVAARDASILRSITTLQKINDQPAAEFLKGK